MRTRRPLLFAFLLFSLLSIVGTLSAQGFRATITGTITDPTGAAIPRARVTVTNTSTNVASSGVTNNAGLYVISYLNPGPYEVTVEAKGFQTSMRRGIALTVSQRLKLDFTLRVGAVHQTVSVTGAAPLLNTVSPTSGQTVSERSITELPQADGNPYAFARLSPGIAYYGDRQFERLIDQDATSSIRINGAPGMSQFTLDGIPEGVSTGNVEPAQIHGTKHGMEHVAEDTNGSNGNFPAFVPPRDAVQEFQLTTSPFSAEYGHSAGGTMNVVFKSGTNHLHGDIYEFDRNTALFAHNFFEDASGQAKAPLHYNRYGGSIGGPVIIPKIYNGRNKTFFFFAGQGFGMSSPSPGLFTVPTAAERQGDFSALLPAGVKIYNPYSATATSNGLVERTPFAGNIITAADLPTASDKAASQIGQNLLNVYPQQNLPCANKYCENNYYSPQTTTDNYNLEMARVDETISDKDSISVNWYREMRQQVEDEWAGSVNGQLPAAKGLTRPVDGAGYEQTYTFSPSTVLDVRLGFSSRVETHFLPTAGTITPQSLGFPSSTTALFQGGNFLPYLEVDNLKDMPDIKGPDFQRSTVYSLDPTLMKTIGRQTLQFGYDGRIYRLGSSSLNCAEGCYEFKDSYTQGPYNTSGGQFGQGIAALYLGLPTGGEETVNGSFNDQMRYNAFFVQDTWSVRPRLTLNLGLRYGIEGAVTERFNQNTRGFNLTSANPIQAAAQAAYLANPPVAGGTIQPPAPSAFNVLGGVTFVNAQNRNIYNADTNNFQPRVGAAYELNSKTVIRGGWGMFMVPHNFWGMNQPGYTQNTDVHESNDNGLTFVGNLYNPFPSGIVAPSGSSLGLRTSLGQGITYYPVNQQNGMTQEWQLEVQRELSRNWLVDATYIGNHGYNLLAATSNLDALPLQYLSTQPTRDNTVIDNLSTTEPNPFHDLAPGSSLNGSDTTLSQLLLPYPEFTGINSFAFNGTSDYDALDVTVKKRFSHGFSMLADYTWSKLLASDILLNPQDTHFTRSISPLDQPQRFVFSGIWHLPFGHGLRFGSNWHGPLQAILGGWQGQWIYSVDSGLPLVFPNDIYYNGNPDAIHTNITGSTVSTGTFPISGFYPGGVVNPNNTAIQLSDHYRTFPYILPNFREEAVNNADIEVQKSFHFGESRSLEIKADLQNAFNHPLFGAPNLSPTSSSFSQVTSQTNFPRNIQLGAWLNF